MQLSLLDLSAVWRFNKPFHSFNQASIVAA